jgi:3'-5' exoribonuclease
LLLHLVLSHHGELEFGSPKVPLFPEALLLHHIDNMDSKMECMRAFIEKDRTVESPWTAYVSSLDRSVLKKQRYLDGPQAPAALPAPAAAPVAPAVPVQQVAAVAGAVTRPPSPPAAQPVPPPPPLQRPPAFQRATSAFAEKLKGALGGKDPQ